MATIDDQVLSSILHLTSEVGALRADINSYLRDQDTIKRDVAAVRADVTAMKTDIHDLQSKEANRKSFVGGILAAWSVVWTGVVVFVWPYLKEKLHI